MPNFKLQVPIDKKTKNQADKKAETLGFSSLQEVVRIFLKNFAMGKVSLHFSFPEEILSEKEEKRLTKIAKELDEEIKAGTAKRFSSMKEAKAFLLDKNRNE